MNYDHLLDPSFSKCLTLHPHKFADRFLDSCLLKGSGITTARSILTAITILTRRGALKSWQATTCFYLYYEKSHILYD